MSESRNKAMGLLELPLEIATETLPSVVESADQTNLMASLSNTCKPLYNFFQKELDQRAAQQLLTLVLKPTKANLEKAKKMYCANPRLLFIEAIGEEYAAGLDDNLRNVHRIVQASPIRAIAASEDIWLLQEVIGTDEFKKYVDPMSKKTASKLAAYEIKKQFPLPNGFDFPSSTYDYGPLLDAITNDQSLIQHNEPSDVTKALLAKFRKDFLPDTVVTSGHFFNLKELVRAFDIYEANLSPHSRWQSYQLSLFWCKVIGYFQGLVTGVAGEVISQGSINGKAPVRHYELWNDMIDKKEVYYPVSENPTSRLGLAFGVNSETRRRCLGAGTIWGIASRSPGIILMLSNNIVLERIYAELYAELTTPTANPAAACKR